MPIVQGAHVRIKVLPPRGLFEKLTALFSGISIMWGAERSHWPCLRRFRPGEQALARARYFGNW
jgi:hypothetical protein